MGKSCGVQGSMLVIASGIFLVTSQHSMVASCQAEKSFYSDIVSSGKDVANELCGILSEFASLKENARLYFSLSLVDMKALPP
jgi:hypothetical protein